MTRPSHDSGPEHLVRAARAAGVTDERLLRALCAIPRTAFVPASHRAVAYVDVPVPIDHGQVTTQPSLVAMMVAALGLSGDEHVLEIGSGYGFQTALLARLAASVVGVERWPDMAERARANLAAQGIENAEVVLGDGTLGMADRAPYDAVVVSAAFPRVPPPLIEQLRAGGRLVQPIGPGGQDLVQLYARTPRGLVRRRSVVPAHFVRLYGEHGYPPPAAPFEGRELT
ncbi:protein-L-isoaspartate(D-aspartate) O-methyltransferase [Streptomyces sp. SCA3-4]|uniref:protein-L-isoaspartate(D-aspartate) O-methyltransferase n=1 Tax=Streptomyces sichuanensis TaxID=2871810 RepID=UPI001CE2C48A|nr:protein-L-isoaspartate(D-aspartate) O-methyltransferase [Streptomyces sichuanensis]MCA6091864.1 protein-L-isoaspartate(D-aspartate) O-methyltransferase [Streptomyces sichuanensis]